LCADKPALLRQAGDTDDHQGKEPMQIGMKHQRLVLDQILVERETPSVISSILIMLMPRPPEARGGRCSSDAPLRGRHRGGTADFAEQARDDRVAQGFRTSQP